MATRTNRSRAVTQNGQAATSGGVVSLLRSTLVTVLAGAQNLGAITTDAIRGTVRAAGLDKHVEEARPPRRPLAAKPGRRRARPRVGRPRRRQSA